VGVNSLANASSLRTARRAAGDLGPEVIRELLQKVTTRGKGGRNPAVDPRLDPVRLACLLLHFVKACFYLWCVHYTTARNSFTAADRRAPTRARVCPGTHRHTS
jgi:hypothetical protein